MLPSTSYLRGLAPGTTEARLPEYDRQRLPLDTWLAAEVPAGVRLEFRSEARAVDVRFESTHRSASIPGTFPDGLSVWCDGEFRGVAEVDASTGIAHIPLLSGSQWYVVYLPAHAVARTVDVRPIGGSLHSPRVQSRWLAYGDSITQGWSASDPGLTYPSILARRFGLDVCNLGFAGSARGETPVAEFIAGVPARVISLAFGTNNWRKVACGIEHFAGLVRDFVSMVRRSHGETPIVVVSPLVRPDAERAANELGATLADLRSAMECQVRTMAERDTGLFLVPGRSLVTPDQLVDGIHPGDEGHAAMAAGFAPTFEQILDPRGQPSALGSIPT